MGRWTDSGSDRKVLMVIILIAMIAIAGVGLATRVTAQHRSISLQFPTASTASKYSLDAQLNAVAGVTNLVARQGQFPNVNGYLIVYYAWCTTTVGGGSLILQQTGGAGWSYTLACNAAGGFASAGDPGAQNSLFTQNIFGVNSYDIIEANTNAGVDTMQGGFVISSTITSGNGQMPGPSLYIVNVIQIQSGQSLHVWYEAGQAPGCAAGTLVCYLAINQVSGGGTCKLDLSGGGFTMAGSADSTTELCLIGPVSTGNQQNFRVAVFNGDTIPHTMSGLFIISIY